MEVGKFGRVKVRGDLFQTTNDRVHAIGDVVGPPGLASSAARQGRRVVDLLFERGGRSGGLIEGGAPLTVWTIPEIAICGLTRERAVANFKRGGGERVVTGYAYFKEFAR